MKRIVQRLVIQECTPVSIRWIVFRIILLENRYITK